MKNFELFQGKKRIQKNANYFEGWYFKQFNDSQGISFIPGINISAGKKQAFIQVLMAKNSYYIPYDFSCFKYSDFPFFIEIGDNYFSKELILLNIQNKDISIYGELKYKNIEEIKKSFLSPNIMGPFSYMPFMECNHAVISMKHDVVGSLIVNNQFMDFHNGFGYIEKDWGTSFPKCYLWCQCNHFVGKDSSMFFSIANIPFKAFCFQGFICVLTLDNIEYRFATYNNSKIQKFEISEHTVNIDLRKRQYNLNISCTISNGRSLLAPVKGQMNKLIKESMDSVINISLRENNKIIFSGVSNHAGLEIVKDKGDF